MVKAYRRDVGGDKQELQSLWAREAETRVTHSSKAAGSLGEPRTQVGPSGGGRKAGVGL